MTVTRMMLQLCSHPDDAGTKKYSVHYFDFYIFNFNRNYFFQMANEAVVGIKKTMCPRLILNTYGIGNFVS